MQATVSMQSVSKSFRQGEDNLLVIDQVSMKFHQGKSYALVGQSGSGKSTCLHLLAGIENPSEGSIHFKNHNLATLTYEQRARYFQKNIGIVFQRPNLIAELSVLDNVMLKATCSGTKTDLDIHRAHQMLADVGLADKARAFPGMLSGGQQQRIALLRALFLQPAFLFVDEPTGSLDEKTSDEIMALLLHYQQKLGVGLIVCTHDRNIANKMDQIVEVKNQKLHTV